MDIRFKVGRTNYALTNDKYQIFLSEVVIGKTGKGAGKEVLTNTKYFQNEFKALASLIDREVLNNSDDITTFKELIEYRKQVLDDISLIIEQYKFKENGKPNLKVTKK